MVSADFEGDCRTGKTEVEVWKTISDDFPKYEVSNLGRIRHGTTKRVKKLSEMNGYTYAGSLVGADKKHHTVFVHRAVLTAFVGHPVSTKIQGNHIDGDKRNNRLWNLEWVTASENTRHAIRTGLRPACAANGVGLNRKGSNNGMYGNQHTAEAKYAMSLLRKGKQTGEANPAAKLTIADVRNIRNRRGESSYKLATEYGLSSSESVRNIWHGRTWKGVD